MREKEEWSKALAIKKFGRKERLPEWNGEMMKEQELKWQR